MIGTVGAEQRCTCINQWHWDQIHLFRQLVSLQGEGQGSPATVSQVAVCPLSLIHTPLTVLCKEGR